MVCAIGLLIVRGCGSVKYSRSVNGARRCARRADAVGVGRLGQRRDPARQTHAWAGTQGVLVGYSEGTQGVLTGYSRGTHGVLRGYSRGRLTHAWASVRRRASRGTRGVLTGYCLIAAAMRCAPVGLVRRVPNVRSRRVGWAFGVVRAGLLVAAVGAGLCRKLGRLDRGARHTGPAEGHLRRRRVAKEHSRRTAPLWSETSEVFTGSFRTETYDSWKLTYDSRKLTILSSAEATTSSPHPRRAHARAHVKAHRSLASRRPVGGKALVRLGEARPTRRCGMGARCKATRFRQQRRMGRPLRVIDIYSYIGAACVCTYISMHTYEHMHGIQCMLRSDGACRPLRGSPVQCGSQCTGRAVRARTAPEAQRPKPHAHTHTHRDPQTHRPTHKYM